jgi:peroxiredoxin
LTRTKRTLFCTAIVVAVLSASVLALRGVPTKAAPESQVVSDFALLDHTGQFHQLSRYATARAVVLYSHDAGCPTSSETLASLQEARRNVAQQNVAFLAIDANPRDDRETLRRETAKTGLDIPILQDDSRLVTESLRVTRSGEAILLDTRSWRIVYRGPVEQDARAAGQSPPRRRHHLAEAITAFLEGRPVAIDARPATATGCAITRDDRTVAKPGGISYAADVVPILRAKCTACHRQGGIAPWAMDSYDQVKAWSPRMRAVILTGRMPPWHADPLVGKFTNDRSLSVEQKRTLVRWIDAGGARGADADPLTTSPAPPAEKWPLGQPDVVIELPLQEVPARGTIEYRYIRIPAPVTRDTWVRAVHIAPRNSAVMHHALLFVEYPPMWQHQQPPWQGGAGGFFAVYAPGLQPLPMPPDSGGFLPAGATLLFQLHYTATGAATTDVPRVGFYFHTKPPALEARIMGGINFEFRIPPNADDYPVEAAYVFDQAATLHGLLPHMHFRGKRFRFEAYYPDGTREVLLSVPRYDFNWQTFYVLQMPKPIPAGTKIMMTGAFDNSSRNPANPDPAKEVGWGHQTWDEMFVGYMLYTAPKSAATGAVSLSLGALASGRVTRRGRSASPRGSGGSTR